MRKLIQLILSYFWKSPEHTTNITYIDKFRVKVIELRNGTKKYYPEYKEGMMSSWAQLVSYNNKGIVPIFMSDGELINGLASHFDTLEESKEVVEKYKEQLIKERELELLKQEIIKL